MSTPLRAQYMRAKSAFANAILLFRLGDFYETYDDDARTTARELALPLAVREFARDERVPLCAVPYHAVEACIKRLVSRGYKVAVCEQMGDPRATKGLVAREVVRVVSPSAALDTPCEPTPPHDVEVTPTADAENATPLALAVASIPEITDATGSVLCTSERTRTQAPRPGEKTGAAASPVQLVLFTPHQEPSVIARSAAVPTDDGKAIQMGLFPCEEA